MAANISIDDTDRAILAALQADGRIAMTDLASAVSLSASAVTERVRRLEQSGVIEGYGARVVPTSVGADIMAFVRLRYPSTRYEPFYALIDECPEILEVHHVTGEDCFIVKVVAPSMQQLESIAAKVGQLGAITTNIVYSSPLPHRAVTPPAV